MAELTIANLEKAVEAMAEECARNPGPMLSGRLYRIINWEIVNCPTCGIEKTWWPKKIWDGNRCPHCGSELTVKLD